MRDSQPPVEHSPVEQASVEQASIENRQTAQGPSALERVVPQANGLRISGILVSSGLALILLAGGSIVRSRQLVATQSNEPVVSAAIAVKVISPEYTDFYTTMQSYSGLLQAQRSSLLGFESAGLVKRVTLDEGDIVEQGALIATLDTERLEAQKRELEAQLKQVQAQLDELVAGPRPEEIAEAEAAVRDVEAQLQLAKSRNESRQQLLLQGAISKEQRDETFSQEATLQARLEAAQQKLNLLRQGSRSESITAQKAVVEQLGAKLATLNVELNKMSLYAPFDGQVAQRHVDEGTVVAVGQPILGLVEQAQLEAHISVPVTVADQLILGSIQTILVAGQSYEARVKSRLPELDAATRTSTVVLEVLTREALVSGQVARLELEQRLETPGVWLPTTALVSSERGLWAVYVVDPSQAEITIAQQAVEILHTAGDQVFVQASLSPEEQIVADGAHRLVPGQQVSPIP